MTTGLSTGGGVGSDVLRCSIIESPESMSYSTDSRTCGNARINFAVSDASSTYASWNKRKKQTWNWRDRIRLNIVTRHSFNSFNSRTRVVSRSCDLSIISL